MENEHTSAFGDFDGDCIPDLLLTSGDTVALLLMVLEENEVKYCPVNLGVEDVMGGLKGLAVGDFDQDAMLDVAGFDEDRDQIVVFYNNLFTRSSRTKLCYEVLDSLSSDRLQNLTEQNSIFSQNSVDTIGIGDAESLLAYKLPTSSFLAGSVPGRL